MLRKMHFANIIIIYIHMYFPFISQNSHFFYFIDQNNITYYYQEPVFPPAPQESLEMPQINQQMLQLEGDIQNHQNENQENITLTQNDLIEAGYEQKKKSWTQEQDDNLIRLIAQKLKWNKIAKLMNGRSIKMCYSRYKRLIAQQSQSQKIRFWSKQEDQKLIHLIDTYGQNWREICMFFQHRKPKQLRERYINSLMPNISKDLWTLEEDLKLISLYNMFGKKWKSIAQQLSKRSENQVKNRFYGRILPLQNKKLKKNLDLQQLSP